MQRVPKAEIRERVAEALAQVHLVGYDDRDPVEAELMHRREREILAASQRVPRQLWDGLLHD